jgi:hypothetical protein
MDNSNFVASLLDLSFIEMLMLIHSVINARSINAALSQSATTDSAAQEMQIT